MDSLNISDTLSTHIQNSLQDLVDDNRIPENYGDCVDTYVKEVSHTAYDGFMPFTNGGFDLMLPTDLRSMWGSGSGPCNVAISARLDKIVQEAQQDALEQFVQENKSVFEEMFPDADLDKPSHDLINYHDLYNADKGELAEQLSEFEDTYMTEGGTFWYQFRVLYFAADNHRNESGVDELLFMAGVNMDFEYGRDEGLEITYEKCVPLEGLTIEQIDTIINDMVESI